MEIRGLPIEVVRKDIKNLHVGVYPPVGRVRVAAPLRLDDDAVRLAVVSRLGWIHRQRARFERQDRQSRRELVSGESHYFGGRRYRLAVVDADDAFGVRLSNGTTITLHAPQGADRDQREAILHRWYRARLRSMLPGLLAKWEQRVGVTVSDIRIRKMKTRWGSCNEVARRVWLNLELAKKSPACLEFILVHEMAHLVERRHNDRFRRIMDAVMPGWRNRRAELNRAPLAHDDWRY